VGRAVSDGRPYPIRRVSGEINVFKTGLTLLASEIIDNLVEVVVELGGKAMSYFTDLFRDRISHHYLQGFQAARR